MPLLILIVLVSLSLFFGLSYVVIKKAINNSELTENTRKILFILNQQNQNNENEENT